MKILSCDWCHAKVNDYSHWYNRAEARSMYELKCVHEMIDGKSGTYNGMIICSKCMNRLVPETEEQTETEEQPEQNERILLSLKEVQAYCHNREHCSGCRYAIDNSAYIGCAVSGVPFKWKTDMIVKGKENEN